MSDAVLRAREIVKTFHDGDRDTPVLKGVDLALSPTEFVALMGPSGSGKSTLLSILGTLLRPSAGSVEVAGRDTRDLSDSEITAFRNRHIGFVFQFHHLLPDFTALENVLFPAYARYGGPRPEAVERARELLDHVGLADRVDYRATRLSGGQKQRVAVARAVMNRPEVVLADEPTGNLDSETSEEVLALLRRIGTEEHTAFLISTHDRDVAGHCDRLIHLVDGRIREG